MSKYYNQDTLLDLQRENEELKERLFSMTSLSREHKQLWKEAGEERNQLREKLAAMESQEPAGKVIKWLDSNTAICSGDGFAAAALDAEIYFKPAPADKPAVAVPGVHNRELLRAIVDRAWGEATESQNVPSTKWADQIIDSVIATAPSHSQQRADKGMLGALADKLADQGVNEFSIAGVNYRCPSHESEQSAHPLTGDVKAIDGQI